MTKAFELAAGQTTEELQFDALCGIIQGIRFEIIDLIFKRICILMLPSHVPFLIS